MGLIHRLPENIIVATNYSTSEQIVISVDAVISEDQKYNNDISQFPIENGSSISDNVVRTPDTITLNCFVSNDRINLLGKAVNHNKGFNSYAQTTYEDMLRIVGKTKVAVVSFDQSDFIDETSIFLCEIYTASRIYSDMFLKSLSIPKTASTGDGLDFTAEFVKVLFADEMVVIGKQSKNTNGAPRGKRQGQPPKNNGKVPTENAGDTVRESIMFKGLF